MTAAIQDGSATASTAAGPANAARKAEEEAQDNRAVYVVLKQSAGETEYTACRITRAYNGDDAIRQAAEEYKGGTYVAIPERSFRLKAVAVETATRVKLADA